MTVGLIRAWILFRGTQMIRSGLVLSLLAGAAVAHASFSQWSIALVGGSNTGHAGISPFDYQDHQDYQLSTASASRQFTGKNRSGQTQTMTFDGICQTKSEFGRLHSYTAGTLTNNYYNENNALYNDGTTVNPNGSPDSFASLGFATFDDTLQFGGSLQAGYKARYYFHLSGIVSGVGTLADLAVKIAGDPDESFFEWGTGNISTTWVTQSHEINGITPQPIHVQFSTQFVANCFDLDDGATVTGSANYQSTLTLSRIEVVDANDNPVSGWTVASESGTSYPTVPEPSSLAVIGLGVLALRRKRS